MFLSIDEVWIKSAFKKKMHSNMTIIKILLTSLGYKEHFKWECTYTAQQISSRKLVIVRERGGKFGLAVPFTF